MWGSQLEIVWTDYMRYRAELRGFELVGIEAIVKYSNEWYVDTETERLVVVGRINDILVMIPCDISPETITPVTVHATTRQQINFRLKTGRFTNE